MAIKVGDAVVYLNANISDLQKKLKQADRETRKSIGAIVGVMQSAGKKMTTAGAVMLGAFAFSGKGAADLGKEMAKIATQGVKDLKKLENGVRDLAVEYGGDVLEYAQALYDLISAGMPEDAAILLMEHAAKGAVAAQGELSSALDLGTSIMNAFNLMGKDTNETAANMEKIMGQAATAVKYGKMTMDDLGGAVGRAAGVMNVAGVSAEEYLSAIAALTTTGAAASEQVSSLKAAVSNIIKPSGEARDAAEALGIQFDAQALQSKGLQKFLDDLAQQVRASGGNYIETMGRLFGSTEALNAVLGLTGEQRDVFVQALGDMGNAQAILNESFEMSVANDPSLIYRQTEAAIKDMRIELGQYVLPLQQAFFERVLKIVKAVKEWSEAHPELSENLLTTLVVAGSAMVVGGPLLIFLGQVLFSVRELVALFKILGIGGAVVAKAILGIAGIAVAGAAFIEMWVTGDWTENFLTRMIDDWIPAVGRGIDWLMDKLVAFIDAFTAWSDKQITTPMPAFGTGFGYRQYATGTRNHPGGLAIVGEQGPELISMPRGSQVFTHSETRQMLGGGSFSIGEINVYQQPGEDGASLARRIREEILNAQRFGLTRGGLVAAV